MALEGSRFQASHVCETVFALTPKATQAAGKVRLTRKQSKRMPRQCMLHALITKTHANTDRRTHKLNHQHVYELSPCTVCTCSLRVICTQVSLLQLKHYAVTSFCCPRTGV
eukprot:6208409-Pleurochrysis_carterae.AAC.5